MRVRIVDHQGKSIGLISALQSQGVKVTKTAPDILLIDADANKKQVGLIKEAVKGGVRVGLYSHGAPVILIWDGIYTAHPDISFYLAQSQGEKEVMQAYGYPHPVHAIGWHYCEQKPFKPVDVTNILFAPWHPDSRGLVSEAYHTNSALINKLIRLPYALTVRYAGKIQDNGLIHDDGISYQVSDYTLLSALEAIDKADLIIANCSTFATLAVARGKPVIMYGQDIHVRPDGEGNEIKYQNWGAYKELLRYRYDAGIGNIEDVIFEASQYEDSDWRERFIGKQLNPDALVKLLERLI